MILTQWFLVILLLLSLALGLVRVMLGPTPADRMLAAQLIGTIGVAILLTLATTLVRPSLIDVALAFAVLAAVAAVAFVQRFSGNNSETTP